MRLEYEGTDISQAVSIDSAWHDMYASGHSDTLLLKCADTKALWDTWGPKAGDRIKVSDGAATTGLMWVDKVQPESSLIAIRALSMPPEAPHERRWKSWEQVKLSQLWIEVCERYGLSYETYGVEDHTYDYVEQAGQPDFEFLARRFAFEGIGFLVFDGKLVIYSEQAMDSQEPQGALTIRPGMDYEFDADEDARFGACMVTDGTTTGTFRASDGKTFNAVIADRISSPAEANRFARGLLRLKNKNARAIRLRTDTFLRSYAAGSVFQLQSTASKSWDSGAFIEHLRHNYVKRDSTFWARQVITDY